MNRRSHNNLNSNTVPPPPQNAAAATEEEEEEKAARSSSNGRQRQQNNDRVAEESTQNHEIANCYRRASVLPYFNEFNCDADYISCANDKCATDKISDDDSAESSLSAAAAACKQRRFPTRTASTIIITIYDEARPFSTFSSFQNNSFSSRRYQKSSSQLSSSYLVVPNHHRHHTLPSSSSSSKLAAWRHIISFQTILMLLLLSVTTTTSGSSSSDYTNSSRSKRYIAEAGAHNNNNERIQNPYYSTSINYDAGVMHVHRPLQPPPLLPGRIGGGGDSLTSWSAPQQQQQISSALDDGSQTQNQSLEDKLRVAEARSAIGSCLDNESCVFSWVCDDIGKPVRFCSGPFFYFTVCCRSRNGKQAALLEPPPHRRRKKAKKPSVESDELVFALETTPATNMLETYVESPQTISAEAVASTEPATTTTTTTTTTSESPPPTTSTSTTTTTTAASLPAFINITEFVRPTDITFATSSSSTTLPSIITIQTAPLPAVTSNHGGSIGSSLTVSSSSSSTARTCGQAPLVFRNSRIVGGGDTQYGALTYQAMVVIKGQERCGGALLDNQWVVTGGHCVAPASVTAADINVKLGEWDRSHDNELFPRVERKVKKFVLHPNYGKERSFANDVALLKLDRPVEYQPHIQPACLPEQPDEDFTGLYGTVSGWGRLNFRENRPNILQYVEVPIMTNTQCDAMFKKQETPEKIIDQMMCAGYDEGGRDACQGDSGGPMAIRKEGAWTLIGIVSWGYGCGLPGYPGVYTRVSKFSDWLVQTMWNDRD